VVAESVENKSFVIFAVSAISAVKKLPEGLIFYVILTISFCNGI
jgi:hypothetical protein